MPAHQQTAVHAILIIAKHGLHGFERLLYAELTSAAQQEAMTKLTLLPGTSS